MRVDAHHHLWELSRFDYVWMGPQLNALRRDFGLQDLLPLLQASTIDRTLLVQTISNMDETRWFLRLSQEYAFIAGVVGWVDLTATNVMTRLEELRATPGSLVGIRHQAHDEPDAGWLLRDDVRRGLAAVARCGLCYDLLIRPEHLSAALTIAHEFDDLRLVIDHIAKPHIATHEGWDRWSEGMSALATCPNVFCKLSGMITEADWANWKPSDIHRYVEHLIGAFGPERLMFGSDWPVCLLAGDYAMVVHALEQNISHLTPTEQVRIFGNTAADFYQLEQMR